MARLPASVTPMYVQSGAAQQREYSTPSFTIAPYYGDGSDGASTISSDSALGTDNFKQYTDLTVNATKVLSGNSPFYVFVSGTLTLNGTISANTDQAGGAGVENSGAGGAGGGQLFLFARRITGTGTIRANGAVGAAASGVGAGTPSHTAGSGAVLEGTTYTAASQVTAGTSARTNLSTHLRQQRHDLLLVTLCSRTGRAGSGHSGRNQGANPDGAFGGGAGSFIGTGGNGGAAVSGSIGGTGGAGGGAGGAGGLVVVSYGVGSAFTAQANGGNGGNGYAASGANSDGGSGGGGGGGGLIILFADAFSGTAAVTGGTGGSGGAGAGTGGTGNVGSAGNEGFVVRMPLAIPNMITGVSS